MKRTLLIVLSTLTGIISLLRLDPAFRTTAAVETALPEAQPTPPASDAAPAETQTPDQSAASTPSARQTTPQVTTSKAPQASAVSAKATFTGAVSWNRYGPVQVRITVMDGKITKSEALKWPTDDNKSVRINELAIPWLNDQVIALQSANLDGVSGATYTTMSYQESLASAIAKAGL